MQVNDTHIPWHTHRSLFQRLSQPGLTGIHEMTIYEMKFILMVWQYIPVLAHAPILNLIGHFRFFKEVRWSPYIINKYIYKYVCVYIYIHAYIFIYLFYFVASRRYEYVCINTYFFIFLFFYLLYTETIQDGWARIGI